MFMNNHLARACSNQYKIDVDNVYKQFAILQQKGYVLWAQAMDVLDQETNVVDETYNERLNKQV